MKYEVGSNSLGFVGHLNELLAVPGMEWKKWSSPTVS